MGDTQTTRATRFGDDWEMRLMGDHLKFLRHGTNPRSDLTTDGSVRYLHYGDIHASSNPYLDPDARPMPTLTMEQAKLLDPLDDGDLVFVDASEDLSGVGKSVEIKGLRGRPVVAGLHTIAVRFYKSMLADGFKAYLQFHPAFCRHLRRLAAGTKVYATNRTHIASAQLPLPPLPEQRAIAAVLSDVDELIGSLEALIAKKRAIKQAAMQELLTGRTRLPGFGRKWEMLEMNECARIRDRKIAPAEVGADTPCVELEHIGQGDGRLGSHGTAGGSSSTKHRFEPRDILFGRLRPYLRKWWYSDRHGVCSTEIWPLVVDRSRAESRFIYALVQTDRFLEAAETSYGTHMPRADWNIVSRIEVSLPPLPEQRAIATILSDMDTEIAALERRLDKTRAIKQGMMQQLLTGSIRLHIPDDDREDDDAHDA